MITFSLSSSRLPIPFPFLFSFFIPYFLGGMMAVMAFQSHFSSFARPFETMSLSSSVLQKCHCGKRRGTGMGWDGGHWLRNFSCFHAKCKSGPVMYIVAYRIAIWSTCVLGIPVPQLNPLSRTQLLPINFGAS